MSELIAVAEGAQQFVAAIDTALAAGHRTPDEAALRPHSWDARVEQVLALLDEVVTSRSSEVI